MPLSFQEKIRPVATSSQGLSFADKIRPVNSASIAPPQQPPQESAIGTLFGPLKEGISGLGTLYGGGEQGIATKLLRDVQEGARDIERGKILKGVTKAGFRTAGDVAGTVYAPLGALIGATGVGKVFDKVGELSQKGGRYNPLNVITDIPTVQKFVEQRPNLEEDFNRALNLLLAKGEKGKIEPSTTIPRTINQITDATGRVKDFRIQRIINKRVEELNKLDNQYVQLRKASGFSADDGAASRKRVASTDVLANAVDENGVIRTKQKGGSIDQYKALTLDQAEGVVRKNLVRLGEKVHLSEIERQLTKAVNNSKLEGDDLISALAKVKKEIEGYALKADIQGNVPLELVHDAKINTANKINYLTSPEIATYRKAIARGLKKTVEDNSSFPVEAVNAELKKKYLDDIAFLERLDGKRVRGGKLGKYFSSLSGNIIGGLSGYAIGGPVGSAIGSALGGEVAGRIKSATMQRTFGGITGVKPPKSPIIQKAVEQAQSPRLALPAPKEGAPRTHIFGGPIINLPSKMPPVIDRGYPYSKSLGNLNQQYKNAAIANKTAINSFISQSKRLGKLGAVSQIPKELQPLAQEARKYKSAEEFVKGEGQIVYRASLSEFPTDIWDKGTYFAPTEQLARYYSESHLLQGAEPSSIKVVKTTLPKTLLNKTNGGNSFTLKTDYPIKLQLTDFYNQAVKGTEKIIKKSRQR